MLPLKKLIGLQTLFAALSLAFLASSFVWREMTGAPLSAAPIAFSITAFLIYLGILYLGRKRQLTWYRLGMIPALLLFGGGGVVGNVVNFVNNGLTDYASMPVFVIAVAINTFGTVLNLFALMGVFRSEGS